VTYVDPAQNNKTVTLASGFDGFDSAIAGQLDKDCTAGGTITLIATEWINRVLHLTGTPGAAFNLVVPTNKKPYVVSNATAKTVTVKTPSGTGIDVAPGDARAVRSDGTNVILEAENRSAIRFFVAGLPGNGALVYQEVFARKVTFPAALASSQAVFGTAATGAIAFTLKKNGSSIGTINIGAGATVATFTFASAVTFAPGDILTVIAPSPQDGTASDFSATLLTSG
jgi:hypothetical protein